MFSAIVGALKIRFSLLGINEYTLTLPAFYKKKSLFFVFVLKRFSEAAKSDFIDLLLNIYWKVAF